LPKLQTEVYLLTFFYQTADFFFATHTTDGVKHHLNFYTVLVLSNVPFLPYSKYGTIQVYTEQQNTW